MLPKQTSGTSSAIKELQYQVAAIKKQLEDRPSYTKTGEIKEVRL